MSLKTLFFAGFLLFISMPLTSYSANQLGPKQDYVGYADKPPVIHWPNHAYIAVQFVLNYEEGAENNILNGDTQSEHLLSDIVGAKPYANQRNMNMETLYEYGSRAGFWRVYHLFRRYNIPITVFAVGMALEKNPRVAQALKTSGWEIASHGYRWIDYQNVDPKTEKAHIAKSIAIHQKMLGRRPLGMYQGKPNVNTRKHIIEEGGFVYDADSYADDLPYWVTEYGEPHLIIPYTLDVNDMRFVAAQGFNSSEQYFTYLKDAFDILYAEGKAGHPKMLSIGLHARIIARPARIAGLQKFINYIKSKKHVWIARRIDIAKYWYTYQYPKKDDQYRQKRLAQIHLQEQLIQDDFLRVKS